MCFLIQAQILLADSSEFAPQERGNRKLAAGDSAGTPCCVRFPLFARMHAIQPKVHVVCTLRQAGRIFSLSKTCPILARLWGRSRKRAQATSGLLANCQMCETHPELDSVIFCIHRVYVFVSADPLNPFVFGASIKDSDLLGASNVATLLLAIPASLVGSKANQLSAVLHSNTAQARAD